jgi:hypothetical protein
MIVRGGRIYRISPRRPPLEQVAFVDCVPAFREWLKTDRPEAYSRLWLGGAFSYFGDVGEEMPRLLGDWNRSRRTQRMQACQLTPDKADGRLRRPQLIGRR